MNKECEAKVTGTEFHCDKCGLVWDINDKEPPKCNPEVDHDKHIKKINKMLDTKFTLVLDNTELPFSSKWMALAAYEKALEGYYYGKYKKEPVLFDENERVVTP